MLAAWAVGAGRAVVAVGAVGADELSHPAPWLALGLLAVVILVLLVALVGMVEQAARELRQARDQLERIERLLKQPGPALPMVAPPKLSGDVILAAGQSYPSADFSLTLLPRKDEQ